jgi:hypothetical protein
LNGTGIKSVAESTLVLFVSFGHFGRWRHDEKGKGAWIEDGERGHAVILATRGMRLLAAARGKTPRVVVGC